MAGPQTRAIVTPKKLKNVPISATPATGIDKGSTIANVDRRAFLESAEALRDQGNTWAAIRKLGKVDGVFSSAIHNMVQIAMSGYRFKALTLDGRFDPEGTIGLIALVSQINTLFDYTAGYSRRRHLDSVVETMVLDTIYTGGIGCELVLDKARLPDRIQTISNSGIEWVSRGDGSVYPKQTPAGGGDAIELDFATIWFEQSHQDPLQLYSSSLMEAALSSAFYFDEFVNDIRRSVKVSGHTRLTVTLDAEKVRNTAPTDVQTDADKLQEYMNTVKNDIEAVVSDLAPEDALVMYDTAKAEHMQSGMGQKTDYVPLMKTINGLLSTGLKTPPSVLGLRLEGSQSLSNTESLIFLKTAQAAQGPVQVCLSRALTLAMRLFGYQGYCEFKFKDINMRPADELEAFKTMKQNRILQQLSLGHITDDEAAWELDTFPRAEGAPDLSGTMFMQTNNVDNPTPNDDPMGRNTQSDQPTAAGGVDNEERP